MKKRLLLISISIAVILISIYIQRNKDINKAIEKDIKKDIFSSLRLNNSKIVLPIIEDDIPIKVPTTTKPKKVEVKRDLSLITAESYLVGNLDNGNVYLKYNSNKVYPIASLTKIFTSIIATHNLDNEKLINIDQKALDAYGNAGNLVLNEKYKLSELLYPLLLESSNDAAEAIAESFGYDKFIEKMNNFAKEKGMKNTFFRDASGLSSVNVSNVDDLFLLAQYLFKNEKPLLEITKIDQMTLSTSTEHGFHHFVSINPFVPYEPFLGGKTGRTIEAKESMVSLFNYKTSTTTYPIAVIILRSEFGEREIDTEKILEKLGTKFK